MKTRTKGWTDEQILVDMLQRDPQWLARAIVRIDENQTADERDGGVTVHANGIGWSGVDAKTGTYLAGYARTGRPFTGRFALKAYRLARKYRRQLLDHMEAAGKLDKLRETVSA